MIILDTNIISEISKRHVDASVGRWFNEYAPDARLYCTSINTAELRYGVCAMPTGKRKTALEKLTNDIIDTFFANRILPFDHDSAEIYAPLAARLIGSGINIGQNDMMIAAIALQHDATIATRNTKHFDHCGARTVNPFVAQG